MKIKYLGESDPFALLKGKEYELISTEKGWYRVIDETGDDYLYPPELFEVIESTVNKDLERQPA